MQLIIYTFWTTFVLVFYGFHDPLQLKLSDHFVFLHSLEHFQSTQVKLYSWTAPKNIWIVRPENIIPKVLVCSSAIDTLGAMNA